MAARELRARIRLRTVRAAVSPERLVGAAHRKRDTKSRLRRLMRHSFGRGSGDRNSLVECRTRIENPQITSIKTFLRNLRNRWLIPSVQFTEQAYQIVRVLLFHGKNAFDHSS